MSNILIVDDDRHFNQQMRTMLTGIGFESDILTKVEPLIAKMERGAIDLVLLDTNMPQQNQSYLRQLKKCMRC